MSWNSHTEGLRNLPSNGCVLAIHRKSGLTVHTSILTKGGTTGLWQRILSLYITPATFFPRGLRIWDSFDRTCFLDLCLKTPAEMCENDPLKASLTLTLRDEPWLGTTST